MICKDPLTLHAVATGAAWQGISRVMDPLVMRLTLFPATAVIS
jgi:hypothetical protein